MDPHSSPYIIPNNRFHNPFPHSLLRTRQSLSSEVLGRRVQVLEFEAFLV